jgi:hypothetical protein
MKRRHVLVFATTLPVVQEEEGDEIIVWPGENVSDAMVEHIVALGLKPDGPHGLEHAGWEFWAPIGRGQVYFRVNYLGPDEIIVPISYKGPLMDRLLGKPDTAFPDFIKRFASRLRTDNRFVAPKWHLALERGDYEDQGTGDPLV